MHLIFHSSRAYYCLGQFDKAIKAYEKGIELDPNNSQYKTSLELSLKKANETAPANNINTPSFDDISKMFPGGLGGLMKSPAFSQLASQMMGNSDFINRFINFTFFITFSSAKEIAKEAPEFAEIVNNTFSHQEQKDREENAEEHTDLSTESNNNEYPETEAYPSDDSTSTLDVHDDSPNINSPLP